MSELSHASHGTMLSNWAHGKHSFCVLQDFPSFKLPMRKEKRLLNTNLFDLIRLEVTEIVKISLVSYQSYPHRDYGNNCHVPANR
jgi:hypothetical protein